MVIGNNSKAYNFTGTALGGISTKQTIVIEQNLGHQIDKEEKYTEITWSSGLPAKVERWEDDSKDKKLWTIEYTFSGGVPTQILRTNEDEGIQETTTIEWANGVPIKISK